jgi:hypothetical protein
MRLLFLFPFFPPVLPFSSTSYSNTPTRWSRKVSLPIVIDDDDGRDVLDEEDVVRQNTEPKFLLLSPE